MAISTEAMTVDEHARITAMQQFLKNRGYPIVVDGVRGPETDAVVEAFHDGVDPTEFASRLSISPDCGEVAHPLDGPNWPKQDDYSHGDFDSPQQLGEQLIADRQYELEMELTKLRLAMGPRWVVETNEGYGWRQYLSEYSDKKLAKKHARELRPLRGRTRVRRLR